MPILTLSALVSEHLDASGFDKNPNLLIIAENYPNTFGVAPWGYFYRTLLPHPIVGPKSFFDEICRNFGITVGLEACMLNDFLSGVGIGGGRRLIIDALPSGTKPIHPITPKRLDDLVNDINYINPRYILVLHNNNKQTIYHLLRHPGFALFIPRLVINPLYTVNPLIFPYPSAPANPANFRNALNAARAAGYPI